MNCLHIIVTHATDAKSAGAQKYSRMSELVPISVRKVKSSNFSQPNVSVQTRMKFQHSSPCPNINGMSLGLKLMIFTKETQPAINRNDSLTLPACRQACQKLEAAPANLQVVNIAICRMMWDQLKHLRLTVCLGNSSMSGKGGCLSSWSSSLHWACCPFLMIFFPRVSACYLQESNMM